tara:strand:- start:78 stop:1109 length:1032 start_codon:yes stop_codon:yes gene_type:complete
MDLFESMFGIRLNEEDDEPLTNPDEIEDEAEEVRDTNDLANLVSRLERGGYSPQQIKSLFIKLDVYDNLTPLIKILEDSNITDSSAGVSDINDLLASTLSKTPKGLLNFINTYQTTNLNYNDLDTTGNIFDKVKKHYNLPLDLVREIFLTSGRKEGGGVGDGEIGLALFFNDVKKSDGDGDNTFNQKPLEVKGTGGRPGKQERVASRNSPLLKLVDSTQGITNPTRFDVFVPQLIQSGVDEKKLFDLLEEFRKEYYSNADKLSTFISPEKLNNNSDVRKAFQKIMISNYLNKLKYEQIFFMNKSGKYYKFNSKTELYQFIEDTPKKFSSPVKSEDLDKQMFTS